jgi:hypothetical protein
MLPEEFTKFYFRFYEVQDCHGDPIFEDYAIAKDLDSALQIMKNGYGPIDMELLGKEPITLWEKELKYVREIRTLRFAGPPQDDLDDN